jgi:hypothetical protein
MTNREVRPVRTIGVVVMVALGVGDVAVSGDATPIDEVVCIVLRLAPDA